jgi:1-deoxy-D-xylulose-5-phosphate reductoisomerase
MERFPALRLAYEALATGGIMPTTLNAANEVAVDAFLAGKIGFTQITDIVAKALEIAAQADELDLQAILAADHEARVVAEQAIGAA